MAQPLIKDFINRLYDAKKSQSQVSLPEPQFLETQGMSHSGWRQRYLYEALVLLLALIAVALGSFLLPIRQVLLLSLILIFIAMAFFLIIFEKSNRSSREMTVIASLIAITVAARSVFYMLPQFKPVGALVIIAGATLGPEVGFIVGSMTMLVSNIFFSQGPWTPWQMIAFGIIGFVAGLLVQTNILQQKRLPLAIFGFLSIFILYGGIINPASVLMFTTELNARMLLLSYVSGAPMDLVHASATVIFIWFLAKPLIKKLNRIQAKIY